MIINKNRYLTGTVVKRSGIKTFKVRMVIWKNIKRKYDFKFKSFKHLLVHDENDSLKIGSAIKFYKTGSSKISKCKSYIYLS
jgi:ribosomal protein S17